MKMIFLVFPFKKLWQYRFSMKEQILLTFEFTRASAVYRSRFSTTIGLCSQALLDFQTDKQKDKYCQQWHLERQLDHLL